ncbi:hypothetical protein ACT3CD_10715 [Geofilum sp. OHC36d9]
MAGNGLERSGRPRDNGRFLYYGSVCDLQRYVIYVTNVSIFGQALSDVLG